MSVCLAYVTGERVTSSFHLSVIAVMQEHGDLLCGHIGVQGTGVALNRNLVVTQFLESNGEWLWFVDDDIVFPPTVLPRLLDFATDPHRPILAALYFGHNGLPMWCEVNGEEPYANVESFITEDEVYPLSAVGMGCTLIHRSVLEAMAKEATVPDPWFGYDLVPTGNGEWRRAGEDTSFCRRAQLLGFATHGVGVLVGHLKTTMLPIL